MTIIIKFIVMESWYYIYISMTVWWWACKVCGLDRCLGQVYTSLYTQQKRFTGHTGPCRWDIKEFLCTPVCRYLQLTYITRGNLVKTFIRVITYLFMVIPLYKLELMLNIHIKNSQYVDWYMFWFVHKLFHRSWIISNTYRKCPLVQFSCGCTTCQMWQWV